DADTVVAVRLAYVEVAAAVARARRSGRLSELDHRRSVQALDLLWSQIDVVEIDDPLIRRAAELAELLGLRGYDAVHCAAAERLDDPSLVAATGDRQLLQTWGDLGVATYDTNAPGPEPIC
ncbi:MAG: type II toxin-antitoxin system VapC family toxin, partial [Nakamurella sp.]